MGEAVKRGNFTERKENAEKVIQELDAKQLAWTETYNHAIEKVVSDTLEKWQMSGHVMMYVDWSIIEPIMSRNDYSEEIAKYTA